MPWNRAIAAVEAYPLPALAAIPVRATAGGCELVLAWDIRVAAPGARGGLLESRLGIIPGAGGTQRLPQRVWPGPRRPPRLRRTAISGDEAARIGLVEHLDADPVRRATELATRYAERGVTVLAAAKLALRAPRCRRAAAGDGLRAEVRAFLTTLAEPAAAERMQAWIDTLGEV
jgi:enoyl-CoA hydratase